MAKLNVYEVKINGVKHRIQATDEYAETLGDTAKKLTDKEAAKPLEVQTAEAQAPANK
ncbi:hypothetical protein FDH58_gp06 [Arthrobacter phage HunterDalle]|uniref:Uncharacterized protein n=6 Tax=Korravirus hunterdalle TaxID=1982080 RepID=A0A3G8FW98_9CAUD|nr:hypothetical protein FDH58_gp06 [Arthrobacter phage HunterDalle]ALY10671.1 hypothetical protein VULTURE_6 [Arthrobacter phage Vulture]AZF98632.1 hypothetical protein SEA_ALEDEL_6 [Arthrobacter phage Aledel]AZS07693.1 hypothetical protein SEA_EUNOIA_6 [Arthrobacter phage Eunoia]AZS09154.1 hypothetical protein SEA_OMALLEY_6 [Arthrobacter phage OMalley]AZS09638.1 hypothetical protein SEA_RIOVINA_6 [Arthrobacter phage Riovina]